MSSVNYSKIEASISAHWLIENFEIFWNFQNFESQRDDHVLALF